MTASRMLPSPHLAAGPCRFTVATFDARFLRCEIPGCQALFRIPSKPVPAIEHSETSKQAARSLDRNRYRQIVWEAFRKAGPVHANPPPFGVVNGLTDEELIEVTGIPASTARPRRVELVRDNLLIDSGYVRKTRAQRNATVWMVAS